MKKILMAAALVVGFCGGAASQAQAQAQTSTIPVVAAENFYADVVQQLGGDRVQVTSILSNPDEDPHLFEASPKTARALQHAALVVYNGADYDPWMDKLLAVSKGDEAHDDRRGATRRAGSPATIRISGTTRRRCRSSRKR